jgi:hypothetical protein
MQTRELKRNPEAFAALNIEGDNFILGDAIKIPIGTKAKAARLRSAFDPSGRKMRTRRPSVVSYSLTVVTASDAPNGIDSGHPR